MRGGEIWGWLNNIPFKSVRTFKWDTVHPCGSKDCKIAKAQSWRSLKRMKNLAKYTINIGKRGLTPFFWTSYFYFSFDSFASQCTICIWKFSQILNGISSSQECKSTFKVCYLHSMYPCLWSACLVTLCLLIVVYIILRAVGLSDRVWQLPHQYFKDLLLSATVCHTNIWGDLL